MRWILASVVLLLASAGEPAAQGKGNPVLEPDHRDHFQFSTISCREGHLGA